MKQTRLFSLLLAGVGFCAQSALSASLTWTGAAGDNNWSTAGNWDPAQVPSLGDEVSIDNTATPIALTASTAHLASLSLSGATLSLSHWNTCLSAEIIEVGAGGIITSEGPFDESEGAQNRVWIACDDITIAEGGAIDVTGKGYSGFNPAKKDWSAEGFGPGKGQGRNRGGAHGGFTQKYGNTYPRVNDYGSVEAPITAGSGGGSVQDARGGNGGGVVRIEATGCVTVYGSILANGTAGSNNETSAGAGGSIYITSDSFAGANGTLSAAGGDGAFRIDVTAHGYSVTNCLNGAGGRIAIVTDSAAENSVQGMAYDVSPGNLPYDFASLNQAGYGTIHLADPKLFTAQQGAGFSGRLSLPTLASWSVSGDLTVTSALLFLTSNLQISVSGDLLVTGEKAQLGVGGEYASANASVPSLHVHGTARVENEGRIVFYPAGPAFLAEGAEPIPFADRLPKLFADSIEVGEKGVITAYLPGDDTKDGDNNYLNVPQVWLECRTLSVAETGAIDASNKGFMGRWDSGLGPLGGGNNNSSGGGHGGIATEGWLGRDGRSLYGSIEAPCTPGSSGGKRDHRGGHGGGVIRINASETVSVLGAIRANGERVTDNPNYFAAGQSAGAGGSVYITCERFIGSHASIEARGGDSYMNFTFKNQSFDSKGNAYPTGTFVQDTVDYINTYRGLNGAGGRISIVYDPTQELASDITDMHFDTAAGNIGYDTASNYKNEFFSRNNYAHPGTLYFPDSTLFLAQQGSGFSGKLYIPGFTTWTVPGDLIIDQQLWLPIDGFQLHVQGNLIIDGLTSCLKIGGSTTQIHQNRTRYFSGTTPWTIQIDGDFILRQGTTFEAFPATVEATEEANASGGFVNVNGSLTLEPYSYLFTRAVATNPSSVLYSTGSVDVQTNATIYAIDFGMRNGNNTEADFYGAATSGGGGGGYGGAGGLATTYTLWNGDVRHSGFPYGDPMRPWLPGVGGNERAGNDIGHRGGGGAIRIKTTGTFHLDGTLDASGCELGLVDYCSTGGAGSGGGILIDTQTFTGSGNVLAKGGDAHLMWERRGFGFLAAGGGGRIAIYTGVPYQPSMTPAFFTELDSIDSFLGTISAAGGEYSFSANVNENNKTKIVHQYDEAYNGQDGTIRLIKVAIPYTLINLR